MHTRDRTSSSGGDGGGGSGVNAAACVVSINRTNYEPNYLLLLSLCEHNGGSTGKPISKQVQSVPLTLAKLRNEREKDAEPRPTITRAGNIFEERDGRGERKCLF